MSTKKVSMIKLREILRLKYEAKLSVRQIGSCLSLSIGVISKYVQRADAAGLGWPLPDDVSEQVLRAKLQPRRMSTVSPDLAEPDFEGKRSAITPIDNAKRFLGLLIGNRPG